MLLYRDNVTLANLNLQLWMGYGHRIWTAVTDVGVQTSGGVDVITTCHCYNVIYISKTYWFSLCPLCVKNFGKCFRET